MPDFAAGPLAAAFRTWLADQMPAGAYVAWVVEDSDADHRTAIVGGGGATGIGSVALNASAFGQPLYESMGYRVTLGPMMFLSLD